MGSAKKYLVVIAGLCLISIAAVSQVMDNIYSIVLPVPKTLTMGSFAEIFKSMDKAIEENAGFKNNITIYEYSYTDDPYTVVLDKMNKNEVDFTLVPPMEYLIYLLKKKSNSYPLVTINMFGKPTFQACAYVRKSDNLTGMEQLRGKIWGGARGFRMTRYLLYLKKIDLPLNKFFKSTIFMPDDTITDMFNALLSKKIDSFSAPDFQVKMAVNSDKKFKDIVPSG